MRAQMALEVIVCVSIVLLISIMVISYASFRSDERLNLEESVRDQSICRNLSSAIQSFTASKNSLNSVRLYLDKNVRVGSAYIIVGKESCYFKGIAEPKDLNRGYVSIQSDANGVIHFVP